MMKGNRQPDPQSRAFDELSVLVMNLLRYPPTSVSHGDAVTLPPSLLSSSSRRFAEPAEQITPAGFASLLLGVSLTLILCGSVTFFIGFMLLPWIIGLLMMLYVAGVVSSLSILGQSVFCYATAASNPHKDVSSWKLL